MSLVIKVLLIGSVTTIFELTSAFMVVIVAGRVSTQAPLSRCVTMSALTVVIPAPKKSALERTAPNNFFLFIDKTLQDGQIARFVYKQLIDPKPHLKGIFLDGLILDHSFTVLIRNPQLK